MIQVSLNDPYEYQYKATVKHIIIKKPYEINFGCFYRFGIEQLSPPGFGRPSMFLCCVPGEETRENDVRLSEINAW